MTGTIDVLVRTGLWIVSAGGAETIAGRSGEGAGS